MFGSRVSLPGRAHEMGKLSALRGVSKWMLDLSHQVPGWLGVQLEGHPCREGFSHKQRACRTQGTLGSLGSPPLLFSPWRPCSDPACLVTCVHSSLRLDAGTASWAAFPVTRRAKVGVAGGEPQAEVLSCPQREEGPSGQVSGEASPRCRWTGARM